MSKSEGCTCCPYGPITTLPAVVASLSVFVTYFFVLVNLVEEGNSLRNNSNFDYPMDVQVAVSFTIITAFLALPLYLAIMMLCCYKFGVEKRAFRGILSVMAVFCLAMLMVRICVGLTDKSTELKEQIVRTAWSAISHSQHTRLENKQCATAPWYCDFCNLYYSGIIAITAFLLWIVTGLCLLFVMRNVTPGPRESSTNMSQQDAAAAPEPV